MASISGEEIKKLECQLGDIGVCGFAILDEERLEGKKLMQSDDYLG